jgi:hypothetical protein
MLYPFHFKRFPIQRLVNETHGTAISVYTQCNNYGADRQSAITGLSRKEEGWSKKEEEGKIEKENRKQKHKIGRE